jgi:DNA-binding MarR family transcriptional regulator
MALKTKPRQETDNIRLNLSERSFYRFSLLAAQINRAIGRAYVQRHGRPAHGWRVLTVLGNFGPLSASDITHHNTLEIDKVTRIVDSLVEQGLVTRQQDSEDRRKVIVALTARGKRTYVQIEEMIGQMEHEFLIVLSSEEREMLYDILERLKQRGNEVFRAVSQWTK